MLSQNLISLVLDLVNESLIPSASGLFDHEEKLLHKSFKMFTCYSNCVSINECPGNSGPLSEAVRDGLLSSVPATSGPPVNEDAKDGPLCIVFIPSVKVWSASGTLTVVSTHTEWGWMDHTLVKLGLLHMVCPQMYLKVLNCQLLKMFNMDCHKVMHAVSKSITEILFQFSNTCSEYKY